MCTCLHIREKKHTALLLNIPHRYCNPQDADAHSIHTQHASGSSIATELKPIWTNAKTSAMASSLFSTSLCMECNANPFGGLVVCEFCEISHLG